jgi:hypothetical protein
MRDERVAADVLSDAGFTELADDYRNVYGRFIGQRIAIYGPNYIWRGKLESVTPTALVLSDVWQVYETRDHSTSECESERISDIQVFERNAICNAGPTTWA